MEHLLLKLARQLDAMDEASLMSLWDKYANIVSRFEPTRQWEEAAIVFTLIQGKRWKNQLFNHQWRQHAQPHARHDAPSHSFNLEQHASETDNTLAVSQKRGKVLSFRSVKSD